MPFGKLLELLRLDCKASSDGDLVHINVAAWV